MISNFNFQLSTFKFLLGFLLLIIAVMYFFSAFSVAQSPPPAEREFRAMWIATVDNIDFPSKRNLSREQQQAEILQLLETARSLKMNAVVFQVRPQCDALYFSEIEPMSEFLTGEMNKKQDFDVLKFLLDEAHKRGILVHAWFNPYRALHPVSKGASANHISKTRPDLVKKYGKYLWLNPTEKTVQDYSAQVIADVVKRYDIDGVHFDDYFYPYPERDANGKNVEFPDEENWQKYQNAGGKLSRADWRRKNVNDFIERIGREIKQIKPEIMYGISPFGIWQPDAKEGIRGFNAYAELFADARKWLQDGTVDYLAPQLYWESKREGLEFPKLLSWWQRQNVKNRHIWAGLATYRAQDYTAEEIANQVLTTRTNPQTRGQIHFSAKHLVKNTAQVADVLRKKIYQKDALIPASPWLGNAKSDAPKVEARREADKIKIAWQANGKRKPFWFVVFAEDESGWSYSVLPAAQTSLTLSANRRIKQIGVSAVDKLGNESKISFAKIRR